MNKQSNCKQIILLLDSTRHVLRNRLNLEVERDDGDDQTLQILYQVVECAKSLGVRTLLDINHRING